MGVMIDDHSTQIHKAIESFSPKANSQILCRGDMGSEVGASIPTFVVDFRTKQIDYTMNILLGHTIMGVSEVD